MIPRESAWSSGRRSDRFDGNAPRRYDGRISIRDKSGQEYKLIEKKAPVWCLAWSPAKEDPGDLLAVGCWDQTCARGVPSCRVTPSTCVHLTSMRVVSVSSLTAQVVLLPAIRDPTFEGAEAGLLSDLSLVLPQRRVFSCGWQ
jgi:hypothetical protein